MTALQNAILDVMKHGEKITADEIAKRLGHANPRAVINSLCDLRGDGYITDGRSATAYEHGLQTWSTPIKFCFHVEGVKIHWMKLPTRYAASPPDIQEKFGGEVIR